MPFNDTMHGESARNAILDGAEHLYNAVKVTMGPRGHNVAIERPYTLPIVTHDGVTVAEHIYLNSYKRDYRGWSIGIDLIRQAASKMNKTSGDGTTTVTVLTYHILNEADKLISNGYNPMVLKREIEALADTLVGYVDELKEDITSVERLREVATISAGDAELGSLIADLVWKVGKDGTVTVEDGTGFGIESDVVEGYTFPRGYLSPLMITDTKKNQVLFHDPLVFITEHALTTADDAYQVVKASHENSDTKRPLMIIADDVKQEAMAYLMNLKTQGTVEVVAVKAPGFGNARTEILEDLAVLTGGSVVSKTHKLTSLSKEDFGSSKSVVISRDDTSIVEGGGTKTHVKAQVKMIREQIKHTTVELEKKLLGERASALAGKVAVIKVGGLSDAEAEEKKFRVDDAVAAAKAALADGIVAGGGITMENIADKLLTDTHGSEVIKKALVQPFLQLMNNAGYDGKALLPSLEENGMGYNVMDDSNVLIDMKKAGIIDPAQVTKQAIQTAISVACTLMTTGALIVNEPEEKIDQDSLY